MKRKLENRNVLITGASRGIGQAIAHRFAEEGANLFICARNAGPLEKTAEELRQSGGKVVAHMADVSDRRAVQQMVRHAVRELGHIDVLVNNAGVYKAARFVDYSPGDFDQILKVNLYGVFHVTQAVLPAMMERQQGKVINVASTGGKWGSRYQSAYNASKHAVVGLTRCLALEMAPFGINVNAVCPFLVETDMAVPFFEQQSKIRGVSEEELRKLSLSLTPMGRFLQPQEVAHLALYLASDESNSMTGQSISLCGGYIMI